MNNTRLKILATACLAFATAAIVPAEESNDQQATTFKQHVSPFLKTYCSSCHGAKLQKGERRFDQLHGKIDSDNTLVDFQDMLDQLNLSEMPPQKSKQPSSAERRRVITWLTSAIRHYHQTHKPPQTQTVLRRLNSREYRNTVRDLLQLPMATFHPTAKFPKDQTLHHLDNVGNSLVTSGHLLANYLEAADSIVNKVLFPPQKPSLQEWIFRDGFRQQPEIDQVHRKTNRFAHMTLYDVVGADKPEGAYGPIWGFRQGVPFDGYYRIRLKAEAVNRLHPYSEKLLGTDRNEPLRLGMVAGNQRVGQLHKKQPIEPLLAEWDLADEQKWYTARVWLDAGYTPRFTFRNGLMDVRRLWSRIVRTYPDQFPKRKKGGIVEVRFNAIKYGKLPQIRIHEIEITGPHFDSWPTPRQKALLGEDAEKILETGKLSPTQARELLSRFMARAYRRPPRDDEVRRMMDLLKGRQSQGRSSLEAFADTLKAILCSPGFLYLEGAGPPESKNAKSSPLSPHALASRLSYFLWSSTPDRQLRATADDGSITQPAALNRQVRRLLKDKKSDAFVNGFLGSWLNLRELGATPPDRNQFQAFYHYDLDSAMRRETFLFTRYLIDENLSITNFVDSDFTFVNKPLARLYGLTPPTGSGFEKVAVTNRRRGGLLGQASILTVTANGIDTSPVTRGVWILDNLLGTPPSPPPPDVEPLDPDVRGAKTIRDQLRKHRQVTSCYDCHRKIDPLGFALENFDPIGRWRDSYNRKSPVDASGELPSGQQFSDVAGLKRILVKNNEQFARALTSKLLAYGTGRQLTPADRPHIDRILTEAKQANYRMADLIRLVVLSEPFRH